TSRVLRHAAADTPRRCQPARDLGRMRDPTARLHYVVDHQRRRDHHAVAHDAVDVVDFLDASLDARVGHRLLGFGLETLALRTAGSQDLDDHRRAPSWAPSLAPGSPNGAAHRTGRGGPGGGRVATRREGT